MDLDRSVRTNLTARPGRAKTTAMQRWLLDHLGLLRPFRVERTPLACAALLLLVAPALPAAMLWKANGLSAGTQRVDYVIYLVVLCLGVLTLLRLPRLAMVLLALAALDLGLGIATRLMPENPSDPVRFAWHALLQAV